MKRITNLAFLALLCITMLQMSQAQTINQKLITGIPAVNGYVDAYSLKYDASSGSWVYGAYDTATTMYKVISPGGTSEDFSYVMTYNALFDSEGNSYIIASKNVDTVYTYYILKNNTVAGTFDYISDGWAIKDNIIYFAAQEGSSYYFVAYDTRQGSMKKGKAYDEIRLAHIIEEYSEGEPMGYVGFNNAGEPYYIAKSGAETFVVIGDKEQKHYSDITWYDLKFNKQDEPCYIAKSQGLFYEERGNTFVVRGSEEYKTFDWVYGPLLLDNSGTPVYVGQDSTGEYKYRSTIMTGNQAISSVEGSIYTYLFTPQGKQAYIVNEETTGKNNESQWNTYLVVDGKKSKVYSSLSNPVFGSNNALLYVAGDKNGKNFAVLNGKTVSDKFDYIADAKFLSNGNIAYVGTNYGNYDKKIPDKNYVFIGDEEYGPYNLVNTSDWKTNSLIVTDSRGNYAYMTGELVDKINYYYKYKVYSGKGESKVYDNIGDVKLINGKLCYFAGNTKNKDTYIYDYSLYVDNKKLGDTYSSYTDLTVSDSGVITFIASKGNDMYYVEAKP